MSLKDLQAEVDIWAKQFKLPYFPPFEIMARLQEEAGELARETSHRFGQKKKKPGELENSLGAEMGDVLFTIICYANSQNIDLDEYFAKTMDKCYGRDNERYEKTKV